MGGEKAPIRSSISECDKGLWSLLSPFLQVKRVLGRMEVQLKSGCVFFWDAGSWIKNKKCFKIWIKVWWLFWGDFWFHYLLGIHLVFVMVRYVYFMNDFGIHIWTWFLNDPWTKCGAHSFNRSLRERQDFYGNPYESWLFLLISIGSIPWIYICLLLYYISISLHI